MPNSGRARKSRLAILSAMLLVSIATPQAHAFEKVAKSVSFTLRCAGLMLSDPVKHVEVCNPVMPPRDLNSLTTYGAGPAPVAPVVVPPPPPVVEPPPPPPDCNLVETNCGPVCGYPDNAA